MNLTLSVDKRTVALARKTAEALGKSLNQAIRDFLEELAGNKPAEADIEELERLSASAQGGSRSWIFDRDELHERP